MIRNNKLTFIIIALSLVIMAIVGLFFMRASYRSDKAEFAGQRVVFSLVKDKIQESVISIVLEDIVYDRSMIEPVEIGIDFAKLDASHSIFKLSQSEEFLQNLSDSQIIYNDSDECFIGDAELFLSRLKEKNIIYLCGEQDKKAIVYQLAEKMSFHILANDVILDKVVSTEAINEKLFELEKVAQKNGYAIAISSSNSLTVELLNEWISSLEAKGIKLIPINDLYQITQSDKKFRDRL
jgi:hypothetical protein